jgi:nicotinamidase/pyrazinamidase
MDPYCLNDRDALVIIDVQLDFCAGGALPVAESDAILATLNRWIEAARSCGALTVLSRDWHPADHVSFQPRGGPWPPHCIQHRDGAAFHPALNMPESAEIVSKGIRSDMDNGSPFHNTALAAELRDWQVERIFVGGLGHDSCLQNTLVDARRAGFEVHLIQYAARPCALPHSGSINVEPKEAGVFLDNTHTT